jgi:GNAT superfamily N-acetyltransferase
MSAASAATPAPGESPASELAVRGARLDDAATIVDFNHRLALESEQKKLDHDTLTKGVDAVLRDPRLGRYFVAAAQDGRVVGQMMVTEEWSDWRNGRLWWLQSVFVDPAHRGQGVFKLLLAKVAAIARDEHVVGLRLYVERHNQRAQATYQRSGFVDAGYLVMERIPA